MQFQIEVCAMFRPKSVPRPNSAVGRQKASVWNRLRSGNRLRSEHCPDLCLELNTRVNRLRTTLGKIYRATSTFHISTVSHRKSPILHILYAYQTHGKFKVEFYLCRFHLSSLACFFLPDRFGLLELPLQAVVVGPPLLPHAADLVLRVAIPG